MRVNGSKERVRLTEADLEPTESRPVLRVAPALAALVWFGSIALATTIYLEWLPANALFESPQPKRQGRSVIAKGATPAIGRVAAAWAANPATIEPQVAIAEVAAPTDDVLVPVPTSPSGPSTNEQESAGPSAAPATPPAAASTDRSTITQPDSVPESTRTIRGSYFSDNTHWAGGW